MTKSEPLADVVQCVLAPNPSHMTLNGTNTYLITAQPGSAVVVDPGPDVDDHLEQVAAAAGRVELVIVTHRHPDHTGGLERFLELTGAPSRAMLPEFCHGAEPLRDGEVIEAAGVELRILTTPGHTSDSICVFVPSADDHGVLLTGDTILGGSTTVIDHPDGTLADYLDSLDKIAALGDARIYPAHGAPIDSAAVEARRLRAHRERRLGEVRDAIAELPEGAGIDEILAVVYADAPERVRQAARASLEAQLSYLRARG